MSDTDDAVAGESADAQVDELDSLLSDFDKPVETGTEPKTELTKDSLREVVDYVRDEREIRAEERTDEAIDSAAKTVHEALGDVLPERAVKGLLLVKAEEDKRFAAAFLQRNQSPGQWKKILAATAKELKEEFPAVDQGLTKERDQLASAVRNASSRAPEIPEEDAEYRRRVQSMSDEDLRLEKRKHGAF